MYNVSILYQLFIEQSIWEGSLLKKLLLFLFPAIFLCFVIFIAGMYYGRINISSGTVVTQNKAEVTAPVIQTVDGKIDLNTITAAQLCYIPGVGEVTAQRIIEYRQENGPFQAIEDLDNVEGIGAKKVEQLSVYLYVGG